ncbi:MAG TPA: ABC transporter permease [Thermoplasmata archaeon]|nr:ABC transporter permease [Thermoplasmata archaeon]
MTAGGGLAPVRPAPVRGAPWVVLQLVLAGSLLLLFVLPLYALFTYAPPAAIEAAARDPAVRAAIWLTLFASGIAVLAAVVLAIPLGYLLARRRFPGRAVVEAVVALPVAVPHLLVGLGLFFLLIPGSPLYRFTTAVGFPVYDTIWGVVLVMVFVSAPYTVLASDLSFRAVDPRVLEAARSLGAGPASAFLTVSFPLALRGIVAGLLLTWARAVSEIGGILILAYTVYPGGPYNGPVTSTISVLVYDLFQNGNLKEAAAVSSLFLLIAFALFLTVRLGERLGWLPWGRGELVP